MDLVPFAEACKMIPSHRPGKRLNLKTLHRWRLSRRIEAVCRISNGRRYWFLERSVVEEMARAGGPV